VLSGGGCCWFAVELSSLGFAKSGLLRVKMEGEKRERKKEKGRPAGGIYSLGWGAIIVHDMVELSHDEISVIERNKWSYKSK
jgi:hypothetical protein